jgi:F-type H+-transporting ATPase subunit gamma
MAETMRDIRRRMKSIESTEHLTNAMRLVSAAKFRKEKKRYDMISRQQLKIISIMEDLLGEYGSTNLMNTANGDKTGKLVVLFTSSRGLCGGYNSSILKMISELSLETAALIAVGSKGEHFARKVNWPVLMSFSEGPDKLTAEDTKIIAGIILQEVQKGWVTEVIMAGMRYENTLRQEPQIRRILPVRVNTVKTEKEKLEFHSTKPVVMDHLLPKYLQLVLYQAAAETAVCEHASRRTAMENASDSANDMLAGLSLTYNRARQQAVTEELIEIVSGSEALK